jgi:Cdc6-like AAA superfamily ATPase
MITSPHVFDDEHLPRELPHRDTERNTLSRAWRPVLHGAPADDVIVSGPSGVGKTALVKYGLTHLQTEASTPAAHIRCLGSTAGDILRSVLDVLGYSPSPTAPLDDLQWTLHDVVDEPVVVVLDEADGLLNNDALECLCAVERLSLVVITHDPEEWLAHTERRVQDRLEGERTQRIALDRYSTDELADILSRRADSGLRHDSVDREQLRAIANEVAGVAREGIQSLRAAAELASERGHDRITDTDIADCYERAQRRIRESNLQSLPYHHQVLYAIIHEASEIEASQLHDRYDAIAETAYQETRWTPIGKRSRRNKLRKLKEYGLVHVGGEGANREYEPVDDSVSPADVIATTNRV